MQHNAAEPPAPCPPRAPQPGLAPGGWEAHTGLCARSPPCEQRTGRDGADRRELRARRPRAMRCSRSAHVIAGRRARPAPRCPVRSPRFARLSVTAAAPRAACNSRGCPGRLPAARGRRVRQRGRAGALGAARRRAGARPGPDRHGAAAILAGGPGGAAGNGGHGPGRAVSARSAAAGAAPVAAAARRGHRGRGFGERESVFSRVS